MARSSDKSGLNVNATDVTGLDCTVALTIDTTTGQHTRNLTYDLTIEPILVLTTNTITP